MDRLLALKGEMSQSAFARKCQISITSLRQYLAGGTPGLDKVIRIANATGASITWLATGEGPRDTPRLQAHIPESEQDDGSSGMLQIADPAALESGALVLLPRLDVRASAGHGIIAPGEDLRDFLAFDAAYLRSIGINPRHAHLVQVEGRSMMPTFVDGEWVIVDTSATTPLDDFIYAVVFQGAVLVKRLRKEGDAIVMESDNKAESYRDRRVAGVDLDDFKIVGRVRRHIRSL